MTVWLYGRHRTFAWWRYLAEQLSCATRVRIVSEFPESGDLHPMPEFYKAFRRGQPGRRALDVFGEPTCREMIMRCRLLRSMEPHAALDMLGAMTQAFERLLNEQSPDAIVSLMIDYYSLDILERLAIARGIRFIGLVDAVFDGQMMFSARGEHCPLRRPAETELDSAVDTILGPTFAPFLRRRRHNIFRFLRLYAESRARTQAFKAIRRWKRDPLNFHYLLTGEFVPDYKPQFRDCHAMSLMSDGWQRRVDNIPPERLVFAGLQQNPEASTDYWVRRNVSLINYVEVLNKLVIALGRAGFTVLIKDHPNMWGCRRLEFFERLANIPGVVLVPYHVTSQHLIERCQTVFTWTGTIGLQAALAGRCAVVVEEPYYYIAGCFLSIRSLNDFDQLPSSLARFQPPNDLRAYQHKIMRHVLAATIDGAANSYIGFSRARKTTLRGADSVVRSLNEYLPVAIAAGEARRKTV